jgi:hypothetical protein
MPKPIKHLLVLSGLLAIGKSYTENLIVSGKLANLQPLDSIQNAKNWQSINPKAFLNDEVNRNFPEYVLFPYELTRLITRPGFDLLDFDQDPALNIVNSASKVSVITLWAPIEIIRQRIQARKTIATKLSSFFKPNRREQAILALYRDKDMLNTLYKTWDRRLAGIQNATVHFWDVSDELPQNISKTAFLDKLA